MIPESYIQLTPAKVLAKRVLSTVMVVLMMCAALVFESPAQAASKKVNKQGKLTSSCKVRSKAKNESKARFSISKGASVKVIGQSGKWYKVSTSKGKGYVKKANVKISSSKKPAKKPAKKQKQKKSRVILSSWNKSSTRNLVAVGRTAKVIDVYTGKSFTVRRLMGSNHMDVEPAKKSDTKTMKAVYGGKFCWRRRPILVVVGGKKYAASMYGEPHGTTQSKTHNGFNGHFCIHFKDSKTHGSNRVDDAHQSAIQYAYKHGK